VNASWPPRKPAETLRTALALVREVRAFAVRIEQILAGEPVEPRPAPHEEPSPESRWGRG
jgi:hypothetical protein